jgi:hypothetical protein
MRYMAIWSSEERDTPPTDREMSEMDAFIQEVAKAGVLVMTDGLKGSDLGVRVRKQGDKITVTDGPFTESKEIVGGFAIFDCKTREEMIEWTKRFIAVAGDGVSEVREMYDQPAYDSRA